MRTILPLLASLLVTGVAAAEPPAPTPAPGQGVPPAATRRLSLDLDTVLAPPQERGHAEFDSSLRRVWWSDPMVRLSFGLAREEAASHGSGIVSTRPPMTAAGLLAVPPGADMRLVLAGPFASDWHTLSGQEKFGRIAESAVYYGLIIGLVHAMR